jgi:hypothetical protein
VDQSVQSKARGGGTVVEHSPHYLKVKGSSPAATGTETENGKKKFIIRKKIILLAKIMIIC